VSVPVYVVGSLDARDWSWLAEYAPTTARLIGKHGGRYLARGAAHRLEGGNERPAGFVMLEFPSREAARAWYEDPEYGPMIRLRRAHARTDLVLVEGISAPSAPPRGSGG
jgi:uncharacterized protein (DUF1330 family)